MKNHIIFLLTSYFLRKSDSDDFSKECQPQTIEEWEKRYFENALTDSKIPQKITRETLEDLGGRLHEKITEIVIPEWMAAFNELTREDCIAYIHNLTIHRTFDGFLREKSVIEDNLVKRFPAIRFEESEPYLDHVCDIDYLGWVGEKAFGIQIKPVTANANFGNYSPSERMKGSFNAFTEDFGGKVFIVFSVKDTIYNEEVIVAIAEEIQRLSQ